MNKARIAAVAANIYNVTGSKPTTITHVWHPPLPASVPALLGRCWGLWGPPPWEMKICVLGWAGWQQQSQSSESDEDSSESEHFLEHFFFLFLSFFLPWIQERNHWRILLCCRTDTNVIKFLKAAKICSSVICAYNNDKSSWEAISFARTASTRNESQYIT